MKNTREEEELPKLNYPKLQHGNETILNSVYLPTEEPSGVFIGTREEGG